MNKKRLLKLLALIIFLIIIKFVEIEAFSFCIGAIYVMLFDVIERIIGDK